MSRFRASDALADEVAFLPRSDLTRRVIQASLPRIDFGYLEPEDPEPDLFFLQDDRRHIRIGVSTTLKYRLPQLQKAHDVPLWLVASAPGTRSLQAALLRHFAAAQVSGHWFEPVPELLQLIIDVITFVCSSGAPMQPHVIALLSSSEFRRP